MADAATNATIIQGALIGGGLIMAGGATAAQALAPGLHVKCDISRLGAVDGAQHLEQKVMLLGEIEVHAGAPEWRRCQACRALMTSSMAKDAKPLWSPSALPTV